MKILGGLKASERRGQDIGEINNKTKKNQNTCLQQTCAASMSLESVRLISTYVI